MSDGFTGEIRIMPFGVVPRGWVPCQGQLLQTSRYAALFSLLGIAYGGDGVNTFGVPNLQGRVIMHRTKDNTYPIGSVGGEAKHTLTNDELPVHGHLVQASNTSGTIAAPVNNFLAQVSSSYGPQDNSTTMSPNEIGTTGNSQGHENMQPYLCLNYCMCHSGVFPSRS